LKNRASDGWIAIAVIGCSIVLFVALALGLSSRFALPAGRSVRVRFSDVTGIKASSQVKYAGARAGAVSGVRMLTPAERDTDPANLVEITLALFPDVPPLSKTAFVSIAADTLLSDKFVLIQDRSTGAAALAKDDVLQGVPPVSFDQLTRNVDSALDGLRKMLGGDSANGALLSPIHSLVEDAQGLLTELKPVVADARIVVTDAKAALTDTRALLADNKDRIGRAVTRLDSAAGSIESLAKKGEGIVRDNEKNLSRSITDLRTTSENLKVTSTYSKFLLRDLSERPSRLIWGGGKPPAIPSEQQILESRQRVPAR
jgi:ABC-type transporter Mla subunit MlaD